MDILLVAAGLVLLLAGGEALVRGAVAVAGRLGVSPLLIGLTVVGFGTSMPELVTSLQAAMIGSPGIAVGNVVGSNVANVLLILGVGALITPIACARPTLLRDGAALVVATLACVLAALAGGFGRPVGGVFLVLLALYLFVCIRQEDGAAGAGAEAGGWPFWLGALAALGGLALTVLGARLLVAGSVRLAAGAGIPETVIGLSVVAVGTSLPELVTTVTAARRGQTDIAFGNVIGSNIYNILGILGVTALVHPIEAPPGIVAFDLWVMAGTTLLLLAFAWTGRRLSRGEGAALLVGYAVYLGALVVVEA